MPKGLLSATTLLPLLILSAADFLAFLALLAVVTGSAVCLEAEEEAAAATAVTADAGGDPSAVEVKFACKLTSGLAPVTLRTPAAPP